MRALGDALVRAHPATTVAQTVCATRRSSEAGVKAPHPKTGHHWRAAPGPMGRPPARGADSVRALVPLEVPLGIAGFGTGPPTPACWMADLLQGEAVCPA